MDNFKKKIVKDFSSHPSYKHLEAKELEEEQCKAIVKAMLTSMESTLKALKSISRIQELNLNLLETEVAIANVYKDIKEHESGTCSNLC